MLGSQHHSLATIANQRLITWPGSQKSRRAHCLTWTPFSMLLPSLLCLACRYQLSSFQSGLVVSTSLFGALAGSAAAFVVGDKLGRKRELLLAATLYGKQGRGAPDNCYFCWSFLPALLYCVHPTDGSRN